ncbi:MAG: type I glutamate--ammonia ligase [Candidatus Micrarchaeia archaeon]
MAKPEEVLKRMGDENIRWVDLQFVDVAGFLHHITIPAHQLDAEAFAEGIGKLDGSSVRGFKKISESDMVVVPDADTYARIPWENNTARFFCNISEAFGGGRFQKDPRHIAQRAEDAVKSAGFTTSYWGPEIEFFVFDATTVDGVVPFRSQGYSLDSREAAWNSYGQNFPIDFKQGYCKVPPQDTLQLFRAQVSEMLEENFNITVEAHHHEVATAGQCEIDIRYDELTRSADNTITYKYVIKNTAAANAMLATFLPKPVFGDNANGLHTHQSLWKGDKNAFYDATDKYAEMSQTMRYYIGGLLEHAAALCAVCAPTTNSYKRLVPGMEAPAYIAWGKRNRSAAVRVPVYHKGVERSKRLECRIPDPSCNPYLAFAALAAAGLDGIKKKRDCGDPVDENIYGLDDKKRKELGIKELPGKLEAALDELESDHAFLKGIFTQDIIDAHLELKREEIRQNDIRPTPYEFKSYLNI